MDTARRRTLGYPGTGTGRGTGPGPVPNLVPMECRGSWSQLCKLRIILYLAAVFCTAELKNVHAVFFFKIERPHVQPSKEEVVAKPEVENQKPPTRKDALIAEPFPSFKQFC
eukprot:1654257-Rhodomonas_salina.2